MPRYVDPGHIPGAVFIPNCASVRIIWTLHNGKIASNVLHGSYTTAPPRTQAWINGLFTAVTTAFSASAHNASISTATTLSAVAVRDMAQTTPPGGWAEIRSNLPGVAGAEGGNPLPANVSYVVSLKSDRRGQAARGRVYLPGFTEDQNTIDGTADPDSGNAAVDFIGRIQGALSSNGLILAIAHPARQEYNSPVPPNTHHDARAAGTVTVNSILKLNDNWDSTRLRALR